MSRERQTATLTEKLHPFTPPKKKHNPSDAGWVLLGCSLAVFWFVLLFLFLCFRIEVHVKRMVWHPKISLNDGRYVIRPFECKIIGKADGCARVRASIHTLLTTFDDEEWRIITLFVNHLNSQLKYTDLFAASCGSIGDFTDIKKLDEGYAMTRQMKHCNFPVRNFDGTFYEQVHPFDPSYFAVKVHPTGALLFTPHHSQLTLLQHIIIQSPFLKQPVLFLSDIPKYWIEDDGTMCLDESHRWRSADTIAWLRMRVRGLHSVLNSIKADIGDLVYNGPRNKASDDSAVLAPPPGRFVFNAGGRASNDPPPGL